MPNELKQLTKEFAASDPELVRQSPQWVQKLFEWSREEVKKTV